MSAEGASVKLSTRFGWYNSSDGLETQDNRGQASGAYIFRLEPSRLAHMCAASVGLCNLQLALQLCRPNGFFFVGEENTAIELELIRGDVVQEARQVFADWATLITRWSSWRFVACCLLPQTCSESRAESFAPIS